MVNTFAVIAAARDSQGVTHSASPSTFEILLWLAAFLLLVWLSNTGRLAESVHRSWKDTWILPGIMSDLPTLKKICRWFKVAMLLLISVMCIVGFLHYFRDSATSSSNLAMQPTADRRPASLDFMKTSPLQFTLALASGS